MCLILPHCFHNMALRSRFPPSFSRAFVGDDEWEVPTDSSSDEGMDDVGAITVASSAAGAANVPAPAVSAPTTSMADAGTGAESHRSTPLMQPSISNDRTRRSSGKCPRKCSYLLASIIRSSAVDFKWAFEDAMLEYAMKYKPALRSRHAKWHEYITVKALMHKRGWKVIRSGNPNVQPFWSPTVVRGGWDAVARVRHNEFQSDFGDMETANHQ